MLTSSLSRKLPALWIAMVLLVSFTSLAQAPVNSPDKKNTNAPAGIQAAGPEMPSSPKSSTQPAAPPSSTTSTPKPDLTGNDADQGDYIPCKFTLPQLRALTTPEVSPTLTVADEEMLKARVLSEALNSGKAQPTSDADTQQKVVNIDTTTHGIPNAAIQNLDLTTFARKLDGDSLAGRTPSQALNQVIQDLASSFTTDKSKLDEATLQQTRTIVNTARQSLTLLQRPSDIGCAMSIFTYDETDEAYGHLIAEKYIAVQVVVRNTNREQDFVLHDAALEVTADPSGRLAGFYSGRDKVIVRSLSSAQNWLDPRNITLHSAQAVGAILSAVVPIFSTIPLTDATAVFNGGFVPGLDKTWKDRSADQLNLLNDTGFTSKTSEQISVPSLGTVMFVIFIPSKQFEEGWWLQPCVRETYVGTKTKKDAKVQLLSSSAETALLDATSSPSSKRESASPESGVDINRALEVCQWDKSELNQNDASSKEHSAKEKSKRKELIQIPAPGPNAQDAPVDLFRNAYHLPFKKWTGTSLAIFRELSTVVVAGTHTVEESQLQPSLSTIACDTDATGNLIFPQPEKDTLTCPVTGKNLDKISKLRLRNAKDATDTVTAEGAVSISGDSTNGSVSFQTAALHALPAAAYSVFSVSGKGVEEKTNQTMHFSADPYATDISLNSDAQMLTIKGYHLTAVDNVVLSHPTGSSKPDVPLPVPDTASKSDAQLSFKPDPDKFNAFDNDEDVGLSFKVGDRTIATGKTFKMKKSAAAASNVDPTKKPVSSSKKPTTTKKATTPAQGNETPKTDQKH